MNAPLLFRQAELEDIAFLVEAIIAAEKSGTERLSYATIYGLKESDVASLLAEMLEEDIEGQELCSNQFTLAIKEGNPVACISTWIEGEHGESSALKAAVLSHYLPIEKLKYAMQFKSVLQELRIERITGTVQVECVYTHPEHRGQGIVRKLIHEVLHRNKRKAEQAQLIVDGSNRSAIRAYEKMGFRVSLELQSKNALAMDILPSNKKCAMLLTIV